MRAVGIWVVVAIALVPTATSEELDGLGWMAGSWRSEIGRLTIEEVWIPASGGLMLGVSRTVSGDRAVSFEFLRVEARPEGVFYVAQPNGRPGTDFELTELSATSAVFENPTHDHPKIIRYQLRPDGSLWAKIEGDEGVQEFRFQRAP